MGKRYIERGPDDLYASWPNEHVTSENVNDCSNVQSTVLVVLPPTDPMRGLALPSLASYTVGGAAFSTSLGN